MDIYVVLKFSPIRHSKETTKDAFNYFQRTHVFTHAAYLILHRALDPPSFGGYGMRRVLYKSFTFNPASQISAPRLGFQGDGIIRAEYMVPPGRPGRRKSFVIYCRRLMEIAGNQEDERNDWPSADCWLGTIVWTDWEDGGKQLLDSLMTR